MGRRISRIGLMGGTFDPPHLGHLWLAETAREQLGLDRILFLPVGQPPHKEDQPVTAVFHRLQMTQLAIQDIPGFVLDASDINRPCPHSTVSLLPIIQAQHTQAELYLLMGSDSLRDFPTWHEPEAVIRQCRLTVLPRPGVLLDWAELETAVPGLHTATIMLNGPKMNLSATEIRRWIRAGHTTQTLTGTAVWQYIRQHNLYVKT